MARHLVLAALILFTLAGAAKAQYKGVIIDAHSQFGCEISASRVRQAIVGNGIAHTLLSARGCRGEEALTSHRRVLKLVQSLEGRASFLISTKLAGMSQSGAESGKKGSLELSRANKQLFEASVGFAEVLVQHAPHETKQLRFDGLHLDLKSTRIQDAMSLAIDRKVPLILHLELNDNEAQSSQILEQLRHVLSENPQHDVVLIHMAQATPEEARSLIESHGNIHFMTSTAGALAAFAVARARSGKHKAQAGWVNLLADPPKPNPYNGWLADYLPTMKWNDDWKKLIEAHPERFVFAVENVFGSHGTRRYPVKLKIWRTAFSLLSEKAAKTVACANAKRLWKLDVAC